MYAAAQGKMAGEQAHNVQVKPSVEEWVGAGVGKWDAHAVSPTQKHMLRSQPHTCTVDIVY